MLLAGLALAVPPPPIVNGEQTDDYANVVMLRHTNADASVAFICTGTLITPDTVLTAAHCLTDVDGYNLTQVRVSSGSVWTEDVPERQATDWLVHPDYSVSDDGLEITADLGLVFLGEPYLLEPAVLHAAAITKADVGTPFRYVGWGSSSDTTNDQGYYKRVADIPLSGLEGEFLLGYDGEQGSATCGGDSGGPVFAIEGGTLGSLVAVHSFGRDDDGTICAGSTSGDTRVDLYVDWILGEVDATTDEEATPKEKAEPEDEDETGGCTTAAGPAWIGLLLALALRRVRSGS